MWKLSVVLVLHCTIVALNVNSVKCFTKEQMVAMIKEAEPLFKDCMKEVGITDFSFLENVKGENESVMLYSFNNCMMKKQGFLDDKGKFDFKGLSNKYAKFLAIGNKKDIKALQDKWEECFEARRFKGDDEKTGKKNMIIWHACFIIYADGNEGDN